MNMEEKLKSKLFSKLNTIIMTFNPHQDLNTHPKIHIGLNSSLMEIRREIYCLTTINLQQRKQKLRKLLISDFLQEDQELREVDMAYINTQP